MERNEAAAQYNAALKLGQKCRRNAILHGQYPYLQVLDELIDDSMVAGMSDMGIVEVPAEQIVGTKAAGRTTAFASNFMPLLPEDTEFGSKWITLCIAHLSEEGIRDPVECYEYMGRFYVQEGNKRVSVLRSYEASTIPCHVMRIIPAYSEEDGWVQVYYEFMKYYQLTGLYQTVFTEPGSCAKFQAALGFDPDHVWTKEERSTFLARYSRFREFYNKLGGDQLTNSVADAMLIWLRVYPYSDLKDMVASALSKSISSVWRDILQLSHSNPMQINTEPVTGTGEKKLLGHLLGTVPTHVNVAFLFRDAPANGAFTRSHEAGAAFVEEHMADRATVRRYYQVHDDEQGEWTVGKAVAEGADLLIATAPPMLGLCRKAAARYPRLKVLDCTLYTACSSVRTFYSRIYEAKFITGAVAAAMAKEKSLGYVADYPIFGVPAGINAFALGARLIDPEIRVQVEWSCTEGDPYAAFVKNGVKVITNRELPSPADTRWSWDWGTYRLKADGTWLPLISPCWNWGIFYEKVINSVLNGGWDALGNTQNGKAINYWWGMDSGVVDVQMSPDLPEGIQTLCRLLRDDLIHGRLDPYGFSLVDQEGIVHNDGSGTLSPERIMHMDYLCDCVDGTIPRWEDLMPKAQEMVRVLGVYRDQIPPVKKGVLL